MNMMYYFLCLGVVPLSCLQEEGGAINRSGSGRQATANAERLTSCIARFNQAPWQGLTMLFDSGLLRRDAKDIALFLKTNTYGGVVFEWRVLVNPDHGAWRENAVGTGLAGGAAVVPCWGRTRSIHALLLMRER